MMKRTNQVQDIVLDQVTFDALPTQEPTIMLIGARWKQWRDGAWYLRSVIPHPAGRRNAFGILLEKIVMREDVMAGRETNWPKAQTRTMASLKPAPRKMTGPE